MDKYVKRGLSAYKIFLKNKFVASIMMFSTGVMMFIAALNGKGNDTYTLPILITALGAALTLWATYKIGYLKSKYDHAKGTSKGTSEGIKKRELFAQIVEGLVYAAIAGVGIFLLSNQDFTNKVLNLMAGFFTTLNGVLNIVTVCRGRENKNVRWKFRVVLMALELILGPFFIISSDSIDISGYVVMGLLTTVAGVVEIVTVSTRENLRDTIKDGKEIVHIIKDGKKSSKDDGDENEVEE